MEQGLWRTRSGREDVGNRVGVTDVRSALRDVVKLYLLDIYSKEFIQSVECIQLDHLAVEGSVAIAA